MIAIISLLSSIVLASLGQARSKARDSKRLQDLIQLRTALEQYALDNQGLYPADPNLTDNNTRMSCWDCSATVGPSAPYHDPKRLEELTKYLNPRPTDPKIVHYDSWFQFEGIWYKVSESRKHYKLTIVGSVENLNSIPVQMLDSNYFFAAIWPKSMSVWSDDVSKTWVNTTNVSCAALNDC